MMDAFVSVDMDGRIREFNEAYRGMLGYTSEELLKLTYVDITPEKWHAFESQILKEQVLVHGYSDLYEKEYRKKDGTVFSIEIRIFLLRDDKGNATAMWAIVRDISGRRKSEEALEESYAKLQRVLGGIINAITAIVEIRDPYTAGHQKRVSRLAVAIAGELGLPQEMIENIRIAATLHDIGKIYVPAEILSKPGSLTDIETNIVKVHPQASYDILKKIELPRSIALVALEHQERFDGSGYPQGLKGNDIIIEARVVAVADTLEAMMFRRPYREASGLENALHEIEIQKGILYDPEVVDAVQRLFRDKRFTFETGK
jgi:PAS domain S-box-containing protein/putative nucleotidyltransferase with HDIG domain